VKTYRVEVTCEQDGESVLLRTEVPEAVKDYLLSEAPALDALIVSRKIADGVASAPGRLAALIAARSPKKT
jgi:hypothetical protein